MKSVLSRRGMFSGHVVVRQWMILATKGPRTMVHVHLDERVGLDWTGLWTGLGLGVLNHLMRGSEWMDEWVVDGWMSSLKDAGALIAGFFHSWNRMGTGSTWMKFCGVCEGCADLAMCFLVGSDAPLNVLFSGTTCVCVGQR